MPKREQFSAKDDAHKREADRQIKLARAAPHNLDTQPDIVAFITDETEKLGQNPLFYGERERAGSLGSYVRKVLKATGGTILPQRVVAWHIGTHAGTSEFDEMSTVMVLDTGEDESDGVRPERVLCFQSLLGKDVCYAGGLRRQSIRIAPEATRESLARRLFFARQGSVDEPMDEPAVGAPEGAVFDREVLCPRNGGRRG